MKFSRKSGFSLVEVLIASVILGLVMTGVLVFQVQSVQATNSVDQQVKLVSTIRSITNEMIYNGSRAHEVILFDDTTASARLAVGNIENNDQTDDICPTGNFVVFVYYEIPKPAGQANYRIAKLIGYYSTPVASGPPALNRVVIDMSLSPSNQTVEQILAANWSTARITTIARHIAPLAISNDPLAPPNPKLFYLRANQSMAVCGQILTSATNINTSNRRTYTRTFYFTVTVRT